MSNLAYNLPTQMDRELVLEIAERWDLRITIKPDGEILCPFEEDRIKLRMEYDRFTIL